MTITNGYTTVETVTNELGLNDSKYTAQIERHIESASRIIDSDRAPYFFYRKSGEEFYTAINTRMAFISFPYCVSVSEVAIDVDVDWSYSRILDPSEYRLDKDQGTLELKPGLFLFSNRKGSIRITGDFGYSNEVPRQIEEACVLMTKILFRRKDAIFGVIDAGDGGSVTLKNSLTSDPVIRSLLDSIPVLEVA